ncbi:MAG TPA: tRNA (adenosine(37)-N6)-dimethylallyltransferase MiaA [Paludibacteraceae bacterium]|nr:tRNA (adenosine(37)-N6)-dimethylallyltransferase MiaA [Paludibacteraceae bacterium]HQB69489.1 tRNA (adenosine(37)-N6)-dimethylallyltransferase MiaA [Paludibacteraceae bacterium]HRS67948.1 tRNA (adenosine(37)-N6)-dimethylallyltransferase MiaA [Paludibacteraceae bacterium]
MNTLFVIVGPTGVGKTDISLQLAKLLGCAIFSCDSRQMFRELKIGTAAPSEKQLQEVPHFFIGNKSIFETYSAGQFELDAIPMIESELKRTKNTLLVGGSMLYVDAICKGIDDIPTIDPQVRQGVLEFYKKEGIEGVRRKLKLLDPLHYDEVDLKNVKRMLHALEVCIMTGQPFSNLRTQSTKKRSFNIVKIGLVRPREELYNRINQRVLQMMEDGLEDEARQFYPHKALNSLNTVGYKEFFNYFDRVWTKDFAVNMIQQNSRRYAKKQLTWFKRDKEIHWFHPQQTDEIITFVKEHL